MKQLLSIATSSCFVVQTHGQVTAGQRIGESLAVTSGTNFLRTDGQDPFDENFSDMEQVEYSERPYLSYDQLSL